MRYRVHRWYDKEKQQPLFGIQAREHSGLEWMHCCYGKTPLLFDTREKAESAICRYREEDKQ